jgi:hypothetical protein
VGEVAAHDILLCAPGVHEPAEEFPATGKLEHKVDLGTWSPHRHPCPRAALATLAQCAAAGAAALAQHAAVDQAPVDLSASALASGAPIVYSTCA